MPLPNGADLEKFAPRDPLACRAALKLPPRGDYLAYIANYHPDEEFFCARWLMPRRSALHSN